MHLGNQIDKVLRQYWQILQAGWRICNTPRLLQPGGSIIWYPGESKGLIRVKYGISLINIALVYCCY